MAGAHHVDRLRDNGLLVSLHGQYLLAGKNGTNYVDYTDYDMQQLLARINDKTENPDRPWVVEDTRNGRSQWVYYGNYDWWHMLYNDNRPTQQHSISLSGGTKDVKYLVSGAYDYQKAS